MSKFNSLINSEIPVLVDVYASWCKPCEVLSPILKEIKSQYGSSLKIIKIDIDKNSQIANKFSIKGVPTLILFKNGNLVWRKAGLTPKENIIQEIENQLNK